MFQARYYWQHSRPAKQIPSSSPTVSLLCCRTRSNNAEPGQTKNLIMSIELVARILDSI